MIPKKYLNRRSIRLKGYDYSQNGLYFITICTYKRKLLFGNIHSHEMFLNEFGQVVYDCWLETEQIRSNIILGDFVVMPNHMHAVFSIDNDSNATNSRDIISENKICGDTICGGVLHTPNTNIPKILSDGVCNMETTDICNRGVCNTPLQSPSQTVGAIVRGYKSAVTKRIHELGYDRPVWQRNYHEHIIRDGRSLRNISQYIIENPTRWKYDCHYI